LRLGLAKDRTARERTAAPNGALRAAVVAKVKDILPRALPLLLSDHPVDPELARAISTLLKLEVHFFIETPGNLGLYVF
jgi:hypothetical protein